MECLAIKSFYEMFSTLNSKHIIATLYIVTLEKPELKFPRIL